MAKKTIRKNRTQRSWDEWYKLAKKYREEHGDLLVPRTYIGPEGEKLGRWVERQRAVYNGVASNTGRLYPEQILLLEDIDMVWKIEYRHPWKAWIRELEWYKKVYGDINIPGDFENQNFHLGNWIREQRKRRFAGDLTPEQIADLDNLGMLWNVTPRPRSWDEWYEDAEEYYKKHGDLLVPVKYQTEDGYGLGNWVYVQCKIRKGDKSGGSLSQEQIDKLDAIHMVWDREAMRVSSWDQMYEWICEYKKENGKLPLWPRDMKAPDGRSMPGWIAVQRTALSSGDITAEKREKLRRIGIVGFRKKE